MMDEQLFKRVFNNIIIFKNIFKYVRIYKTNKEVTFENRKQLKEYKEREFIETIVFTNENEYLQDGDLPKNCVLKAVKLCRSNISSIHGRTIPNGVEILKYFRYSRKSSEETSPLTTLPSSIHTIAKAVILKPHKSENIDHYAIPSNITSISFTDCINISGKCPYLYVPGTVRSLKFGIDWNNEGYQLCKNDIPEGVTSLSILGYDLINELKKGVLPNSIKQLEIAYFPNDVCEWLFDFIPPNIESLFIDTSDCHITQQSNLLLCKSIKKLVIDLNRKEINESIHRNSLPTSITELSINNFSGILEKDIITNNVTTLDLSSNGEDIAVIPKGSIPNSVTSLKLSKIINERGILPESLTHLELLISEDLGDDIKQLIEMLFILPKSLISIALQEDFKQYNIAFPSKHNNIIKYKP